ncbi:MAG: amidohydrolase [Crocinitomicaceae bacterium]|nr:amidohydrolase [Crocinitomicaceae bacterium]
MIQKQLKYLLPLLLIIFFTGCFKGEKVDLIIHNGYIMTMDQNNFIGEAMAVNEGKIIAIGPEREILNRFRGVKEINAAKKTILPGLHDAHGHMLGWAKQRQHIDLRDARSYAEMLLILEKDYQKKKSAFIIGNGWNQSVWGETELPSFDKLNARFPETPVALTRIDGHAMLINQAMMDFVGINTDTRIEGGEILLDASLQPTGILLDKAMDLVYSQLPAYAKEDLIRELDLIQNELLSFGITHVHEAGLFSEERELFIQLAEEGFWKINVYAMLFPDTENQQFAKSNGFYQKNGLTIRSFKILLDGALGSRGAWLLEPYSDAPESNGLALMTNDSIEKIINLAKTTQYQLNTHCIGDAANRKMLQMGKKHLNDITDHRWRIEHAQVIHPDDFILFDETGMLPSVQPVHATSDYKWLEDRIGKERMKGAYAYQKLLDTRKMIAFGTDFPIENIDPFATLFAAVQRKNSKNEPSNGFMKENAVDLKNALKAMTIWAAFACFDERYSGSLEKGKAANFVILEMPISKDSQFQPNFSNKTFVNGKLKHEL